MAREPKRVRTKAKVANWVGTALVWAAHVWTCLLLWFYGLLASRALQDWVPSSDDDVRPPLTTRQTIAVYALGYAPDVSAFLFATSITAALIWAARGKLSIVPAAICLLLAWLTGGVALVSLLLAE